MDKEALEHNERQLKELIEKGILMKVVKDDDPMIAEVWPERKFGRKRRKKMTASAAATGDIAATATACISGGVPSAKADAA